MTWGSGVVSRTARAVLCATAIAVLSGCASHRAPAADGQRASAQAATGSLEEYIGKVRQLSSAVRPRQSTEGMTLERREPELQAAQALLAAEPTAEHHRAVGEIYARNGVLDAAHEQFKAALKMAPRDAAAHEGLARVWRDWGYPHLGLTDAHRAVFYAPSSPSARNTLGTFLLKMGLPNQAGVEFEHARTLDPGAAYPLSNLCYVALLQGHTGQAIARCNRALDKDPGLTAARNNLALAYAAAGDFVASAREFAAGNIDEGSANYNMGVALMAIRNYDGASGAFERAVTLRPTFTEARLRAQTARGLAGQATTAAPSDVR